MDLKHVPLENALPDCKRFIDAIMGRRNDVPPPLVEYIVDEIVLEPIVREVLGRPWVPFSSDRDAQRAYLDNFIEFWLRMGHDFVRLEIGSGFETRGIVHQDLDTAKQRNWCDQHHGCISTWDDFEQYRWPDLAEADLFVLEYVNDHLPEGMGFITCHAGGPFENISGIMSIEGLCLALMENPELVQAVAERVGEVMTGFYRQLLGLDRLVALFQGDDMGFRTGTLVSPDDMRTYSLPWHKRFAEMAHEAGLPYFLHSCGNVEAIMEDLIEDVGIDAKHSYEDAIIPVQDFQVRYGDRIGVLGGLDLNILSGKGPDEVRAQTRFLMETCGVRGRYAVGSGNSVPSYVPPANYLAMVDEAAEVRG